MKSDFIRTARHTAILPDFADPEREESCEMKTDEQPERQIPTEVQDKNQIIRSNYEILGLPEGAAPSQVERKYGALLRQYKQKTDEYGTTNEDLAYYKEITSAYETILGKPRSDYSDTNPTSIIPYKVRRFWGKLCARIDLYKLPICGAVLIAVIGVLVFFQLRDANHEDISIKFAGAFNAFDTGKLSAEIAERSETVQSPLVSFYTVTTSTSMQDSLAQSQANQFRAQLFGGQMDIILVDQESFEACIREAAFLRLDDFIAEYSENEAYADLFAALSDSGRLCAYTPAEGDPQLPGIYGIDITDSAFFDETSLLWQYSEDAGQERTMILTICRSSKRMDIAKRFAAELVAYDIK